MMKHLLLLCLVAVFGTLPCLSELINHKNHDVNVNNMKNIDVTASTAVLTQTGIEITYYPMVTCLLTHIIQTAYGRSNNVAITSALPRLSPSLLSTLSMVGLFFFWYAFNAGYNVYNAFVKKDFQYPWATSSAQLLIGLFYAIPLWITGVRKLPKLTFDDMLRLLPIACLNAGGHCCAVIAMFEKGGGSFTHVIKASEPVVSVLLNLLVNKEVPKPLTAISLLPITYGVAYASTLGNLNVNSMHKELTTKAAKMAMGSNFAFAMRSILRKNLPKDFKARTNLDPANEHAVTTALSFLLTIPLVLYHEKPKAIMQTITNMADKRPFMMNLGLCGKYTHSLTHTHTLTHSLRHVVLSIQ